MLRGRCLLGRSGTDHHKPAGSAGGSMALPASVPKTLDTAAGVTLALMAIMLLWDVAGM
jgi:hypothetical protein